VSASKRAPFAGTVTLTPPAGVTLDQTSWKFNLKPGEIEVKEVRVTSELPSTALLKGEIKESGSYRIYRGQVPIYAEVPKFQAPTGNNVIKLEAGKFTESVGGKAYVISGRPFAKDGCMVGWDNAGHKITWKATVPQAGIYRLHIQYAAKAEAKRRLSVNGAIYGEAKFPSTGGNGESGDEWNLLTLKAPLVLNLNAGSNDITMENIDNNMINLAYFYIEPAQ